MELVMYIKKNMIRECFDDEAKWQQVEAAIQSIK